MKLTFDKLVTTKPQVEVRADNYTSVFYDKDTASSNGISMDPNLYTDLSKVRVGDTKPEFTDEQANKLKAITVNAEMYSWGCGIIHVKLDNETYNIKEKYYYRLGNSYYSVDESVEGENLFSNRNSDFIKYAINNTPLYEAEISGEGSDEETTTYHEVSNPRVIIKTGVSEKPTLVEYVSQSIGCDTYAVNTADNKYDGYYVHNYSYGYYQLGTSVNSRAFASSDCLNGCQIYKKTGDYSYEAVEGVFLYNTSCISVVISNYGSNYIQCSFESSIDGELADETIYFYDNGEYRPIGSYFGYDTYYSRATYYKYLLNNSSLYTKSDAGYNKITFIKARNYDLETTDGLDTLIKVPYEIVNQGCNGYSAHALNSEYASSTYYVYVKDSGYCSLNGTGTTISSSAFDSNNINALNGYSIYKVDSDGSGNTSYTLVPNAVLWNE